MGVGRCASPEAALTVGAGVDGVLTTIVLWGHFDVGA